MQRTQLSIEFAGSQLLYVIKSGEHIVSLLCAVDNTRGILLLLTYGFITGTNKAMQFFLYIAMEHNETQC